VIRAVGKKAVSVADTEPRLEVHVGHQPDAGDQPEQEQQPPYAAIDAPEPECPTDAEPEEEGEAHGLHDDDRTLAELPDPVEQVVPRLQAYHHQ
jgi:hypothetical protein